MRRWGAERIASALGGRIAVSGQRAEGPDRAVIDSREAGPGALFFGLPGETADGGAFAPKAIDQGAWGVVVAEEHAESPARYPLSADRYPVVIAVPDPLQALHNL